MANENNKRYTDASIFSFENFKGKYIGNMPTNETEYNSLVSEQDVFTGTAPTWAEIQTKATELETADTNEAQSQADLKASAKAKLMAGEALTEDEANTVVI